MKIKITIKETPQLWQRGELIGKPTGDINYEMDTRRP